MIPAPPVTYRIFRVDVDQIKGHDQHCASCRWEATVQYVLAQSQKQAESMVRKGEAGLCGDCMCGMISGSDAESKTNRREYVVVSRDKP
jgi:hypothetical protein